MADFVEVTQFGGDTQDRLMDLPTFADNAAALAGGLVVRQVYKTATGEVRIVV